MPDVCYPDVPEPYQSALREAITLIQQQFQPLLGVVFAGSILRGEGDPRSDIDTVVIFAGDYRQRLHRRFHGVRFEIFANPPRQIQQYFREEQRDGGASTMHMLTTGHIAWQKDTLVADLRQQAAAILAGSPDYDPDDVIMHRYMTVDKLENAFDLRFRDPAMAHVLLMEAVSGMLTYYFKQRGEWVPRHKDLAVVLRRKAPEIARRLHHLARQSGDARFADAAYLADAILGTRVFFESETPKDPLPPADDSN
jgi:hypothetical protein